jgi:NADPH:quinone reductase-like Zn-dependent oxidoreductase/acyl carrier protein
VSLTEESGGRAVVTISSRRENAKEWVRHASGVVRVGPTSNTSPSAMSRREIEMRCLALIESRQHYAHMDARGLFYGPAFRGVTEVRVGADEILARVHVPDELRHQSAEYLVHPALLDACFQAALWALQSALGHGAVVPIEVDALCVYERPPVDIWVHAQIAKSNNAETPTITIRVHDESGRMLFEVGALHVQVLDSAKSKKIDPFANCIFEIAWRNSEIATRIANDAQRPRQWLVLSDSSGVGSALTEQLRARGNRTVEVTVHETYVQLSDDAHRLNPTDIPQWEKLLAKAFGKLGCHGVIDCLALDGATFRHTTEKTLTTDMQRGLFSTLRLVQAIVKQGWRDAPKLFVLTRGAQAVEAGSAPLSVSQSMLWGLGRVIAMEHPDMGCVRIDLAPERSPDELAMVLRELSADSEEDQIAYRSGHRYAARLTRAQWETNDNAKERLEPAAGRSYRLDIREPGVLERLVLRPIERRMPGPGEVEIEVNTAGLNFIDVMKAMGIYPGMDPSSIRLGGECAGTVTAVGEGVTKLSVGQAVITSAPSSFASHVTTRAEFVTSKPERLSFEEAATIPAVFMTVYWALHHVGRLQRGERILIHSATGGTGLAAIQYAQAVGAEVFATAGSEEKRAFLRGLGIQHVMDSRSLAFADEVMAKTGGRGVDVVLNSLTGEAMVRSLEILAPYGRFLEIGKKDIYENSRLGMLPFRKAISYTSIDLAGMAEERPHQYGALLEEVTAKFADGTFKPEPVTVFSTNDAQSAFRLMAQAKHMGKIAIRMRDPEARIHVPAAVSAHIRANATYLVTGGLGGLGLSLAEWMVQRGAAHLVLVGRSAPNAAAELAISSMRAAGAIVHTMQANVARRNDVDAVITHIHDNMPPLRGIVHAAAILADRTIAEMDEPEFFRAIEPKVFGAWNLHEATRSDPLDFFVMYSSSAGLLGSPGQANYAAANAFLDALGHSRTAERLPATSIQWGAFADVGLAAAADNRGNRIASRGSASFKPAEGNELFGRVIASPRPEVSLMHFDVRQWVEFYPQMAGAPFVAELIQEAGKPETPQGGFRDELELLNPTQRLGRIESHLLEQLGKVLRLEPGKIDKRAPFTSLGIDSLMSLELRNRLEASLGLKLAATVLFTYATTQALVSHLVERLFPAQVAHEDHAVVAYTSTENALPPVMEDDMATEHEDDATLVDKLGEFEDFLK